MMTRMLFASGVTAAIVLGIAATPSAAAIITWGPATAVSTGAGNSSDVSTNGVVVEAFNAVTGTQSPLASFDVVVNGVSFTATADLLSGGFGAGEIFSSGTDGGDASYDTLLSTLDNGGGTNLVTLTLGEGDGNGTADGGGLLSIGDLYEIQVWFVDDRGCCDDRVTPVGDGNGNTVDLNDQFAIGTFTADGTTQQITLASPDFGNAHINAYQIRNITPAVPEPSAIAMIGIGMLGVLVFARRLRRQNQGG